MTFSEVADGLWVTDIDTARTDDTSQFETVVTTCQESIEDNISADRTYHWFNMSDGEDNYGGCDEYWMFAEAVDTVLASAEPVLIHCHKGQSRSVTVATTALAVRDDMSWHDAYEQVRRYRPQADPNRLLVEYGQTYAETSQHV